MKKITLLFCGIFLFSGIYSQLKAQNCATPFYAYDKKYKAQDYEGAYANWKKAFDLNCTNFEYYENILADGEKILKAKIASSTTKADSTAYASDLVKMRKQKANLFPDKQIYWESASVSASDQYGLITPTVAFADYKNIFDKAKKADTEIHLDAVIGYFYAANRLYDTQQLSGADFLSAVAEDKKMLQWNADKRRLIVNELQHKKDSIGINANEEKELASKEQWASYFEQYIKQFDYDMYQKIDCDLATTAFQSEYEANKDNLDWLLKAITSLEELGDGGCQNEFYTMLDDQLGKAICAKDPEACKEEVITDTGGGDKPPVVTGYASLGYPKYKAGNYSAAIPLLKKDVDNVKSRKDKGTYAYYLAESYKKTGNLSNAIIWYKKSANFKPAAAPYAQIGTIFGTKARINSCGNDAVQKLSGYLVAADYMRKAARYKPSYKKYARQYEAAGPTENDIFKTGKYKKGQNIRVKCYGGATTKLR